MISEEQRRRGFTEKRLWALVQGNWRRHANARHDGKPQSGVCLVCGRHSRVMRALLVDGLVGGGE